MRYQAPKAIGFVKEERRRLRRVVLDKPNSCYTLLAGLQLAGTLPPGEGGVSPAARGSAPFERINTHRFCGRPILIKKEALIVEEIIIHCVNPVRF